MANYLAPGVYVEEVSSGIVPISPVSTSIAGFVGMTERGSTVGLPTLVTSLLEFQRNFGGYLQLSANFQNYSYLLYAVDGFFANGGELLYIARVAPSDATAASTTTSGGMVTLLQESTSTDQAQRKILKTTSLRGIQHGTKLLLRMTKDGISRDSGVLTVQSIDPLSNTITVDNDISSDQVFDSGYTTVFTDVNEPDNTGLLTPPLATPDAARPTSFIVKAKDPGSWGKNLAIQAFHESAAQAEMDTLLSGATADNTKIRMKSTTGFYSGAWVEIDQGDIKRYRRVRSVDGTVLTLWGPALASNDVAPHAPSTATVFSTCEFQLLITYDGVAEQLSGLTLENVPGRYYVDQLSRSKFISVDAPTGTPLTHPFLFPSGNDGLNILLDTGGSDGASPPTDTDYRGIDGDPGQKSGMRALEDIEEISIVAVPGVTSQQVQSDLINQCERLRYRFAILDPAPESGNVAPTMNDIVKQRNNFDTKYAAFYYPRVIVSDPVTGNSIPVPPSGHMAGIYANVDNNRGVHKAPANEVISGILDLETRINKREQEILNPKNINVLRDFRIDGRGLRVWGARCITSDTQWKYINVRRLFIFIEASLDRGTQWVVFEPNDYPLWARVTQSVSSFLTTVWRDGALMGQKVEEAFFVRCDRTTMTQDDIDNGRLIILVGIAPVKPAEFVIIRISQFAGGASTAG